MENLNILCIVRKWNLLSFKKLPKLYNHIDNIKINDDYDEKNLD